MYKKQLLNFISIIVLVISLPLCVLSQTIESLPQGVSIHQLNNGMQVLLIENPALPMVGVNVVVKVGSAYETFTTSGMSHMLEHLLFNGTTTRTQKQLYDETDLIGGYNNANTSDYFTNYMMVTPAEHIEKGMELQADMLFNSILPEEKFEKEKGIVLEEIAKSLGNPTEQIERNIISILYPSHALSLPTLGTYSTIKSMKRDNVWKFYKNNYVPNNMILSIIGNFQSGATLEKIEKIYGVAQPGIVRRDYGEEWSLGFKPILTQTNKNLYYRFFNGENVQVSLFYDMSNINNSDFFNLLDISLEKKQDNIQSVLKAKYAEQIKSLKLSSRTSPIDNQLQVTLILMDNTNLNAIINDLKAQLQQLNFSLSESTVEAEIAKARTKFLKNIEKPHMFGIYNAHIFAIDGIEAVLAFYKGSGYFQAAQLLKTFKISGDPLIIIQNPSLKKDEIKSVKSTKAELFVSKEGNPDIIAVTNPSSNLLAIHYMIKNKAQLESKYGKDAAKILHNCIEQRLKSEENQKIVNRYGLTFVFNDNPYIPMDNIYLHPDFSYLRVEGLAEYYTETIKYLNEQLSDFLPTKEEFEKAVNKFKSGGRMMMGGNKAKEIFTKKYESSIYEKTKYPEGSKLEFDNLLKFTNEFFIPSNMIVSVVSPTEQNEISELFSTFKGNQTGLSGAAYERELISRAESIKVEETGGGEQSYLYWGFTKIIEDSDKPALKALSLILSDKIIFDIREKQGMAYRMSAGTKTVKNKAIFYINMGTRPQNVEKLLPQFPEFFKKKMVESLNETELEKAINMYLGRMMFRRLSSINQAYYLAHSLYFNGDINYDQNFHSQLRNVKVDDVKNVAQKYMNIENPVSVVIR
jgi:predicted Zn-dependent peptidase